MKSLISAGLSRLAIALAFAIMVQLGSLYVVWDALNSRMSDLSATQDQLLSQVADTRENVGVLRGQLSPIDFQKFGKLVERDFEPRKLTNILEDAFSVKQVPRQSNTVSGGENSPPVVVSTSAIIVLSMREDFRGFDKSRFTERCVMAGGSVSPYDNFQCVFENLEGNVTEDQLSLLKLDLVRVMLQNHL